MRLLVWMCGAGGMARLPSLKEEARVTEVTHVLEIIQQVSDCFAFRVGELVVVVNVRASCKWCKVSDGHGQDGEVVWRERTSTAAAKQPRTNATHVERLSHGRSDPAARGRSALDVYACMRARSRAQR
jgi:hypothetical protein